jgi:hypothetical protein
MTFDATSFLPRIRPTEEEPTGTGYLENNGLGSYKIKRERLTAEGSIIKETATNTAELISEAMHTIHRHHWHDDAGDWYPLPRTIAERVRWTEAQS